MDIETYNNLPFDTRFMVDMMLGTIFNEALKQIFSTRSYKGKLDFIATTEIKIQAIEQASEKLRCSIYGTDEIFERILRKQNIKEKKQ